MLTRIFVPGILLPVRLLCVVVWALCILTFWSCMLRNGVDQSQKSLPGGLRSVTCFVPEKRDIPLFILGDLNCRVGSVVDGCIGPHAGDLEDEAGEWLRNMCGELDLIGTRHFQSFA